MALVQGAATAVAIALPALYVLLVLLSPRSSRKCTPDERTYRTPAAPTTGVPLPSIHDPPSVNLSVVIPAFNESLRIQPMLETAIAHLSSVPGRSYEIIVVNDCSRDPTTQTALQVGIAHPNVDFRVIPLQRNRGKGGCVQHGVLHSRGERVLMVDADGASRFKDLELLWAQLDKVQERGHGVAVGSRAHMVNTEAVVKRSFIRNLLMYGFHFLLRTVGVGYIHDTQCGFKLFTRESATVLFEAMHIHGWIFDVELLILAKMLAIPVAEVAIDWHEIEGSKMNLLKDAINMAKDVIILRANYTIGRWRPPKALRTRSSRDSLGYSLSL